MSGASEAHAKLWASGDGLLVHYAAELLAGCREHRDPRNAVKLFSMITTSAWARMPSDVAKAHKKEVSMPRIAERRLLAFSPSPLLLSASHPSVSLSL